MDINSSNPLVKHFRQPAIYFKLPSQGRYWREGAITLSLTGEIGVMSMTTKDEITLRTPDALMNGQGVVDVIQSCCPSIHDAWAMPSIDVDSTLIAIRIASYGNSMDFGAKCPHCEIENDYAIDLGRALASIQIPSYDTPTIIEGLEFLFKPQPYAEFNKSNIIAYEEQQIIRALSEMGDSDTEVVKQNFDLHLNKVIELNVNLLSSSTESIKTPEGVVVNNPEHIFEFFNNADGKIIKAVQKHLTGLAEQAGIKPVVVICANEQCQKEFPIVITFDYASFFAIGS